MTTTWEIVYFCVGIAVGWMQAVALKAWQETGT